MRGFMYSISTFCIADNFMQDTFPISNFILIGEKTHK